MKTEINATYVPPSLKRAREMLNGAVAMAVAYDPIHTTPERAESIKAADRIRADVGYAAMPTGYEYPVAHAAVEVVLNLQHAQDVAKIVVTRDLRDLAAHLPQHAAHLQQTFGAFTDGAFPARAIRNLVAVDNALNKLRSAEWHGAGPTFVEVLTTLGDLRWYLTRSTETREVLHYLERGPLRRSPV